MKQKRASNARMQKEKEKTEIKRRTSLLKPEPDKR
jgi:hypothetical protein